MRELVSIHDDKDIMNVEKSTCEVPEHSQTLLLLSDEINVSQSIKICERRENEPHMWTNFKERSNFSVLKYLAK